MALDEDGRWTAEQYGHRAAYPTRLLSQPRQRRMLFSLAIKPPADISFENFPEWDKHLRDETMPCRAAEIVLVSPQDPSAVYHWLCQVQRMVAYLLNRSYIPCFDPVLIASISARPRPSVVYDVIFELPVFSNYLDGTVRNAFDEAIGVTNFMMRNPPDFRNREVLWNIFSDQAVPRIASDNRVNSSTIRVLHEAYRQGVPFTHMGQGVYHVGWGAAGTIMSASTTEHDPVIGMKLARQKFVTAAVLRDAGLPAPRHFAVSDVKSALGAAEQLGWPVVVKPADLERGEGVEVDVDKTGLQDAAERALKLSPASRILVEQQVKGVCHRLFIISDQLLYAVKRLPIGVYGDGKQSIRTLVDAAYEKDLGKPPWGRSKIRPIDELGRAAIASVGLSENAIPEKAQFVPLRRIESTAFGGVDEDVTDAVHPDNVKVAIEATRLLGLSVAGVDIITDDISRSWTESDAIINEVNFSPLLGGGEISRQHLERYLDLLLGGSGLIPVEVFVGADDAMEQAQSYIRALSKRGVAGYLTNDLVTLDATGNTVPLRANNLAARVRALLLSRDVEALAIVVQSGSLLEEPLPAEFVDSVHYSEDMSFLGHEGSDVSRDKHLKDLLKSWVRTVV